MSQQWIEATALVASGTSYYTVRVRYVTNKELLSFIYYDYLTIHINI